MVGYRALLHNILKHNNVTWCIFDSFKVPGLFLNSAQYFRRNLNNDRYVFAVNILQLIYPTPY